MYMILQISRSWALSWSNDEGALLLTNVQLLLDMHCSEERVTVESFLKLHNVESNTAAAVLKIVTTMGTYLPFLD